MVQSKKSFWYSSIGNGKLNELDTDDKLAAFTSLAALLTFVVSLVYFLIDLTFGNKLELYLAFSVTLVSLLVVYLSKKALPISARIIFIVGANMIISVAVLLEPIETGVAMLFTVVFIGAILGFGSKSTQITLILLGFIVLSTLISILYSPFQKLNFTQEYLQVIFKINLLVTIFLSSSLVYFALILNLRSEERLKKSTFLIQEKNNELAKVNSELDRFVYSASHDLKSPITSALGLINLLRLTDSHSETNMYLNMMEGRLNHLNKFIGDIVSYSRNSRQTLNLTTIKLKDLINSYLKGLEFLPEASSIQVKVEVPDNLTIISDETRLEMVLGNIITNAFKYYDPTKEHSFVRIKSFVNGLSVQIEIQDNGVGIQNDYLNKVFDMFFRGHHKAKGAGLGLYIVKETLEKLNGSILVESKVGEGSQFTINLPIKYPSEPISDSIRTKN
jgi:signal transduction histidine kinase